MTCVFVSSALTEEVVKNILEIKGENTLVYVANNFNNKPFVDKFCNGNNKEFKTKFYEVFGNSAQILEVPCYGWVVQAVKEVSKNSPFKILEGEPDLFAFGKLSTIVQRCKDAGIFSGKLQIMLEKMQEQKVDAKSFDEDKWDNLIKSCGVPKNYKENLHYKKIESLFGIEPKADFKFTSANKECSYKEDVLRMLSKLMWIQRVPGCCTDFAAFMVAMYDIDYKSFNEETVDKQIHDAILENVGKQQSKYLNFLFVGDCEHDDLLTTSYAVNTFGKSNVVSTQFVSEEVSKMLPKLSEDFGVSRVIVGKPDNNKKVVLLLKSCGYNL